MKPGKARVRGEVYFSLYSSSEGTGSVTATASGLLEITLPVQLDRVELAAYIRKTYPDALQESSLTKEAAVLLERYFSGKAVCFNLQVDLSGFTPFQSLVYRKVLEIPYGATRSYGEIAREIGRPGAARGVGAAMARNPLPIIIPCHRVVGANGKMTGYSAPGGVQRKRLLLEMEGVPQHRFGHRRKRNK